MHGEKRVGGGLSVWPDRLVCVCGYGVCVSLLDVLADLPLEAMPAFLQLLDGAFLGELVGSAAHLRLGHAACEQLLEYRTVCHHVVKMTGHQGNQQ